MAGLFGWALALLVFLSAQLFNPHFASAEETVPTLTAWATDLTGTLTESERRSLDETLHQFELERGSQVLLLIVPTTKPETIEQYSLRVVEKNKVGRSKISDGVLLLVAKEDRAVRIEVGYGLEGAITDLKSGRIINEIIIPRFKEQRFFIGLQDGLTAILSLVRGEELPLPKSAQRDDFYLFQALFFIGFFVMMVFTSIWPAFGTLLGAAAVSVVSLAFQPVLPAILLFFLLIVLFNLFNSNYDSRMRGSGYGPFRGSSGGGFGGFRGGGGGFGGGGASGRW